MIKHFILGYFALLQIGSLIETILRHNLPCSWFAVRPSMDNSEMRLFVWMTEALGAAKRFVPPCHFTLHTALTTDRPARGQGRGGAASYRPRQKIIFIYTSQSRAPHNQAGGGKCWYRMRCAGWKCSRRRGGRLTRSGHSVTGGGEPRPRSPRRRRRHAPNTEPSKLKKILMCIGNAFHCVTVTQLYLYCKMNGNKHINT